MSTGNSVRITFFIFVYFFVSTILRNYLSFDCLPCGLGTYFHHLQREVTCKFYFILSFTINYSMYIAYTDYDAIVLTCYTPSLFSQGNGFMFGEQCLS
jgi:hypothetical protein